MTALHAALLGVIQGLTEFLPISSSAHLILARAVFGWDIGRFGLAFDVACHLGTLIATVAYFFNDVVAMTIAMPRMFDRASGDHGHRLQMIVVGTVPVILIGLVLSEPIDRIFRTPPVTMVTLALGGLALLVVERLTAASRGMESLTWREAVAIGVAQAAALVPGVSRSGATITVGLWLGLRRHEAARFGFLLGIPAILAAAGKTGMELDADGFSGQTAVLFAVGLVTSAVVGYLVITYFLRYLARHSLDVFAYYRLVLALAVLGWLTL